MHKILLLSAKTLLSIPNRQSLAIRSVRLEATAGETILPFNSLGEVLTWIFKSMKMKKIVYIILAPMALLFLHSCQDLDIAPIDRFTDANYWESTEKAQLVLNMAYNQMYGADRMWRDEFLSDNLVHTYGTNDPYVIRKGQATSALNLFNNEWDDAYGGIKTCLVFLENVDRVPNMSESVKNRMIDEIRFIRAYIYFRLVNYYGDVPFFLTQISLDDAYTVSRTPRAQVLSFVHQELDEIIQNGNLP